ncbi:homeobox protein [Salix suchowensis]|nr:homeobox protein [Salix suchowensis]
MGKRKRSSGDHKKTKCTSSSDDIPCSSGTELLSGQKSYLLDSSELRPLSPRVDVSGGSLKLLNIHSHAHQNYNLGRSIVLKRSRHHYGHQYSRRNSGSHADASTSRGKTALSCDERLTFKLSSHLNSEPGCHTGIRFSRPDRVRFSSLVMDAVSSDALRIVCGICQKLVRRRPYFIGNALTAGEFSVKQVLKICVTLLPIVRGLLSERRCLREQE